MMQLHLILIYQIHFDLGHEMCFDRDEYHRSLVDGFFEVLEQVCEKYEEILKNELTAKQ